MSLPNYLAKIKSSGIYRFVWDKSEIAGVDAEVLRLVVGYSEKGPFNTPVYIQTESEFKNIFGNISKKLEKRGIWFHRLAIQALAKGPIIALNLKKFDDEKVSASSFDTTEQEIKLTSVDVKSIYDTTRFWKLDPEAIYSAVGTKNKYISLTATDSKDSSVSVFIRGYKPTGYDVTVKNWYSTLGEELPDYFLQTDTETGKQVDYSSLLVSDFFAEMYVFKGQFTPALCATEPLNKYFDISGDKVQLKEYIENAFGEKTDTLTALAADDSSNFLNSYSGCLLPYFKNQQSAYISLDLLVNADSNVHKLMMNLNADLLYDGTITPDKITTTGWLSSFAFGSFLKKTTEVYTCSVEETPIDGTDIIKTRDYSCTYTTPQGKEQTAFDTDIIEYKGAEVYKYIGGYEYYLDHLESISLDGATTVLADVYKYKTEKYLTYDTLYLVDGKTYYKEDTVYVKLQMTLEMLKTLQVNKTDTSFTVTGTAEGLGEGTAKVKVDTIEDDKYYCTCTEADSSISLMVNDKCVIYIDSTKSYKLAMFDDPDTGYDITAEKEDTTEKSYYRYEGVESVAYKEYKMYHTIDNAGIDDDIYVLNKDVYTKAGEDYIQVVGAVAEDEIEGQTGQLIDYISLGFSVGDRVLVGDPALNNFYTITELASDYMKLSNMYGDEKYVSVSDTVVKCNHSAGITCYQLLPYYFEGYTYKSAAPVSNTDFAKLEWQKNILSVLTDYAGIRSALTNRVDIDYRYIVDTFEAFVDTEVHKELALIAKEKDNAVAFLNFPSAKTFKKCEYTKFTDENGEFKVKYIKEGGNKKKNPGKLFTLVSEVNGASFVSYNTPLVFSDGTVNNYVPAAALVSNNFMDKYSGRQPYYVVAGPTYGRLIYNGLVGPDFNYSRADLDILEPMGVNVTVFVPRLGTYINSNQTAKQNPKTALSALNVRELVIYLQDEIEKLLQGYQWEFNTPYLRDLIKAKADTICENVKNNGGIQEYLNVCDTSNNTNDVIDNEMFVLSTSIEPGRGCGKMVQELTLYKTGGLSALIK